ncbi:hypothetical protein SAY87_027792 [Trapa incisa]|uniref:Uncharacterized protein n=1 Tax=Trapa incisa TaxID=236973 RepID=A0AAN7JP31_9MYRT|nr:hypothetical protein SAY87_027792 [Trapa incisa]
MEAEAAVLDGALKVVEHALSHIKWRLRPHAKRRLEIDLMALCTRMRPVVMVDYGGKLPELQDYLCGLLRFCHKESPFFEQLRVMIIEDMIFLIHPKELAGHVNSSLSCRRLYFVDLEQDPPLMITQSESSLAGVQLVSMLNLFARHFPLEENGRIQPCNRTDETDSINSPDGETWSSSQSSDVIDLSSCMKDTKISVPTLNGWLLGYPVIYLFTTDHIEDAIYNLSMKSLRIYRVLVHRMSRPGRSLQQEEEELMSFSVPYDLSMGASEELWAQGFMSQIRAKWEGCRHAWGTLRLEVSECYPQAIVL